MNARDVLEGMIRTDRGDMTVHSPVEVSDRLDAFRAEVLREEARRLRRIEQDLPEGGRESLGRGLLKAALVLDEQADLAGGKSSREATATPQLTGRLGQLLDAIRTHRGEWTTRKVQQFYRVLGIAAPLRTTARKDLHVLLAMGHLAEHDDKGRRLFTLATRKDGR